MPYTRNVPQQNQTIASTTDPIRNNFMFLEDDLQVEHSFNGNIVGVAEGVHKQCSMQSQALSPTLPAGTNGMYFVNGTDARYYDNTNNWLLSVWTGVLKGSWTSTNSYTVISAVPANTVGIILLTKTTGVTNGIGIFNTEALVCHACMCLMNFNSGGTEFVDLENNTSSLNISGKKSSGAINASYNYTIFYRPL